MAHRGMVDLSNMDWDIGNDAPRYTFMLQPERTCLAYGVVNMYFTLQLNTDVLRAMSDLISGLVCILDECIVYAKVENNKHLEGSPSETVRFVITTRCLSKPIISKFLPIKELTGKVILKHFAESMTHHTKIELGEPLQLHFQFA